MTSAFADLTQFRTHFLPHELPEIFAAPEDEGENDAARDMVRLSADALATKFVLGHIATYSRPINGGEVTLIDPDLWEIDDPLSRFATGAFNLEHWADTAAPLTHRIFVDGPAFDNWLAGLRPLGVLSARELESVESPQVRARRSVAASRAGGCDATAADDNVSSVPPSPPGVGPELLKIAEVSAMVAQSRSTIYAKMKAGDFPESLKLGGSARWSKYEVITWINEQAAKRAG